MNERWEEICARLCLLTDAGLGGDEPAAPMTRPAVRRMIDEGALRSLVLRHGLADEARMEQAEGLLARARRVYGLLADYEAQGYRGVLPQDEIWPQRLAVMGRQMPLFLFMKGNAELLLRDKVAVAGSRSILPQTQALAARVGRRMAREGITLVSGGARGVDTAAQDAALNAGGSMILVPALTAHQLLKRATLRRALDDGRLLVLCDTLPDAPFTAAKAIARNHIIYALGAVALVLASRAHTGGSWHGAMDCLRAGWTPVYVSDDGGEDTAGNRLLLRRGAKRYDEGVRLRELMDGARARAAVQMTLRDLTPGAGAGSEEERRDADGAG